MSAASTSIPITASVVEIIEEYANNDLPTWNLTVKRRQKMVITVFAFLAYIKMIEGKRDDMKGQEEFMQVTVGSLVADWVENKGLLNIQSKEVDLLLPHFEKMMVKTTAGKVCFANYSKYTEKKQVKYTGKMLMGFAKTARKLIQRDAYPKWLELCEKKSADKAATAGPRSGMNFDQVVEQVRVAMWTVSKVDDDDDDSDADDDKDDMAVVIGEGAAPAPSQVPGSWMPFWWYVFLIHGPWGSHRYGYGMESLIAPVKASTNGPDAAGICDPKVTKKEEQSRRHLAKQSKLDVDFAKKKEAIKTAADPAQLRIVRSQSRLLL
jgi:hypothetical protein